eukprot:scaffold4899_cov135-Isochrysis_galbana.AAC.3
MLHPGVRTRVLPCRGNGAACRAPDQPPPASGAGVGPAEAVREADCRGPQAYVRLPLLTKAAGAEAGAERGLRRIPHVFHLHIQAQLFRDALWLSICSVHGSAFGCAAPFYLHAPPAPCTSSGRHDSPPGLVT